MRQIEVVDLVWNHTGRGVVMWYCPLSPGGLASSTYKRSRCIIISNIALFLDSGVWQGLEGCPKGAFIFTTPPAKIQLLHKQHDTATLERGGANRACCTSRFLWR